MSTQFTNRQWRLPNNENKDKQSNYSMDFDSGSSDKITLNSSVNLGTTSSISVWIKPSNYNVAVLGQTGFTYPYVIYLATSGKLYFNLNWTGGSYGGKLIALFNGSTSNQSQAFSSFMTLNSWNHLVITRNVDTVTAYINGYKRDFGNFASSSLSNNTLFNSIGVQPPSSSYFNGEMDSLSAFNYVLSDGGVSVDALATGNIATLYGSSSTGIGNPMSLSPKPVAYYPLGDQDSFNGADYLVPNSSLKDYVFDFPGNGDNITIDNLFNFSGSDLCISIWYNSNSVVNYDYLLYRFGGSSVLNVYVLNNKLRYEIYAGSTRYRIEGNVVFDGNWHNSIMIFNDAVKTWTVYEDSVFVNTLTATASIDSATTSFYIGSYGGSTGNDYSGLVSNLVIWNSDQSSEKDNIYNNGTPASSYTNTPSGWWKLDASDTYDSSTGNWTIEDHAGSNDGTSSGMTQANLVQSDLSFTSGYSPYALDFDAASSDYIDCGSLSLNSNTGTVSAWIKTSYTSDFQIITAIDSQLQHRVLSTGEIRLILYHGGSFTVLNSTATVNNGNWHNVTFTYSSSGMKIYIDGSLNVSNTVNVTPLTTATDNFLIGARSVSGTLSKYFNGSISNVSVWNTELTATQVSEIYNEGVPSNLNNHSAYSNLVSWWQLGSNSSFNTNWTVLDEKGSNNGTSSNMTEDAIVDGVGSYANGTSSGMGGDEVIGDAPYSSSNSLSVNMDVLDRVEDTPS